MENSLSVQSVLNNKSNYNLAIPFVQMEQINPFYKLSVATLYVDISRNASETYKVGSRSLGNNRWEDLYSLKKPFLQRLATDAGIQFAPGAGDVIKMDENTWKASAYGAIRLPDGSIRTSNNFKVIDLVTEEKKYLLSYEEKAEKGITEERAAKDAASKYSGKWDNKVFIIDKQDRERYIKKSLLEAMTQLRANAPQKATTGAILRVIRDLLGIKGIYTIDELKKPFAVVRMSFSPDYNDPVIKQMMLQQALQSVGNLFGNTQPVLQTISVPQMPDPEEEIDQPVDVNIKNEMEESNIQEEKQENMTHNKCHERTEEDRKLDFYCDKCGKVIPEKVWNYSVEKFDRPLCYSCQKIIRDEQRGN